MHKLRCGGCGNEDHKMYVDEDNNQAVFAQCTQCDSVTKITITQPKIKLDWTDDSKGILTQY